MDNPWDTLGLGLGMGNAMPSLGGAGGPAPLPSFAQPTGPAPAAPSAPSAPPMGAQPAAPMPPMAGNGLTPDPHVMFQNFQQTDAWKQMPAPMQAMIHQLMQQQKPQPAMQAPDTSDIKPGANGGNAFAQGFGKSFKMPSLSGLGKTDDTAIGKAQGAMLDADPYATP